jgi:hypothetical protein
MPADGVFFLLGLSSSGIIDGLFGGSDILTSSGAFLFQLIRSVTAIATQARDTYGDIRSPVFVENRLSILIGRGLSSIQLTYPCAFPEQAEESIGMRIKMVFSVCERASATKLFGLPFLVPIDDTWHCASDICTCAYQQ